MTSAIWHFPLCSYDCTADAQCNFWQYDDVLKRCARKTGNATRLPPTSGALVYVGPKVGEE